MSATSDQSFIRLLTWFSPSFPVGAYTYSHGLEFAVEAGRVTDPVSLENWVGHILHEGGTFMDGVFFAEAWHAVTNDDRPRFVAVAERAAANRATSEMALEATAQGEAFLEAVSAAWTPPGLDLWTVELKDHHIAGTYPVAAALICALHKIDLDAALLALVHGTACNLVSAGMRLIPLGQAAGQKVLAALSPTIEAARDKALTTPLDQAGSAAPMVDWTSMNHETQYTRLFRS